MSIRDVFLPATDLGVLVQGVVVVAIFAVAFTAVRRDAAWRLLVAGAATMTAAWFGLRMLH